MFLSEWREFPSATCLAEKQTWWQLASRCCWNRVCPWHASKLVSFLVGLRTYQHPGKTQAEIRWKHLNSKRQETFKACQSAERVMATTSRWTHTSLHDNWRECIPRHAVKTAGGYSLEETWTSVAKCEPFTTALRINTANVWYKSRCSRFTVTFLTRHLRVLTLTRWLPFVWAAEATPEASPIPL